MKKKHCTLLHAMYGRSLCGVFLSFALLMSTGVLRAQDKKELPDSMAVDSTLTTVRAEAPADTVKTSTEDSTSPASEEPVPDTVLFRGIPEHEIGKMKSDPDFEYANDPRYWQKEDTENRESALGRLLYRLLSANWFHWFVYCLLAGVLLFAIYKIVSGHRMYLFYKSPKGPVINDGEDGIDIYDEDFDAKIREAIDRHDFRMGVRYLFLKALRVLSDKELIRFHIQSTNQEYADQLKGHPLERDFKFLAYAYEYVWYGERSLLDDQFERLLSDFRGFYKTVGDI